MLPLLDRNSSRLSNSSNPPGSRTARLLVLTILPIVTLALGWQLGAQSQSQKLANELSEIEYRLSGATSSGKVITDPEKQVDVSLMWSVWDLLLEEYIEPEKLQVEPMLYGAVSGMVRGIDDPYTVFMTPKQNTDFRRSLQGTLQGIGAELTLRDGLVVIVAPLKGSPAKEAGLMPEDIIVEVDGESIDGESLFETVDRIRGPEGTDVTLTIFREGSPELLKFTMTRAEITIPSVEAEIIESASGKVLHVSVNQFGEGTTREVNRALQTYDDGTLDGLIVDVRFNGGGYLDRAVDLTSMFVRQGKVVSVQRRRGEPDVHYVYGQPIDTDTPMVILINEGSASASEIFAGALQDHDRATIIGETSFGKGTVQEIFELPGGASVRITVARWITPDGRDLGAGGVDPDIRISRTADQIEAAFDPQLEGALQYLLTGNVQPELLSDLDSPAESETEEN